MTYDRAHIEDEAARWLLLLSEDPENHELVARFEAWRKADPVHEEVWARTERAYELIGQAPPTNRNQRRKTLASLNGISTPARFIGRPALAAAMALAACLLIAMLPEIRLRFMADYVTATAEVETIDLTDGSRVHLAPESALAISFKGGKRTVDLIEGQAYFEVSPDPDRPFTVATGAAMVTVLGTRFSVHKESLATTVAVRSGYVRVESVAGDNKTQTNLRAGQTAVVATGEIREGRIETDEIAGWINGELVARNRPIREIIDALRPYHDGLIVVRGDRFATRRVSGIYSLTTPEDTLRSLAAAHGARLKRFSPWILVVADN